MAFSPHWADKKIASYDIEYYSEKLLNIGKRDEIHLKFDVVDGSIVDGLKQPLLFSFVLDKAPDCKNFFNPETAYWKNK